MSDIDMYVKSRFTMAGREYGASHLSSYDCRELATSYMVGNWQETIKNIARGYLHDSDYYNYGVISVLLLRAIKPAKLRVTTLFDEALWNTIPSALRDDVSTFIHTHYGIRLQYCKRPHLIDNSTWWEKSVQRLNGYRIVGDARVIPAFFWSVFFFRSWMFAVENGPQPEYTGFDQFAQFCFDNEDEEEFYSESDDDDEDGQATETYYGHLEAYNTLLKGQEPPAATMLAWSCGPIDAFNGASRIEERIAYINDHPLLLNNINAILEEVA